ncbi:N-terminal EF-hand calcium-binding protein 1 [Dissostichus eleginoides]|uniref:N-terminal EF-hand calcium-binding protein 1 n=1 Tax=Dissostichus eleginoides TaxID=100907 RepID=A0AAD9CB48_DISEL|nr:N-terminal EF-hand calcium-binding protein 1 [Dissostichus eleginoides]
MLACTEMITMCLQSAKHDHMRKQKELDRNQNQSISLFHDIFRRADKNDDGKLSLEEFQSYFTDGILTDDQMQELYSSIDRKQTDNLDIDKLSGYLSPHVGEYVNVLSALEKLNVAILKAMDKTKEDYQGSSVLGQFVTRFLLRETSTQLQSLQSSLDCAMDAVHDQGCTGRRILKKPEELPIQRVPKRPGRRIQKNMCLSRPTRTLACSPQVGSRNNGIQRVVVYEQNTDYLKGVSVEPDNHWGSQINQLEQLIDKLECESPHLEPLKEDTLAGTYNSNILLIQRQMSVKEKDVDQFQQALKIYTETTSSQPNNLHVSVQNLPDRSCFIMYEFWQDRLSWMSYLQSSISKTFQRCIIDSLEEPEMVSTMLLPGLSG